MKGKFYQYPKKRLHILSFLRTIDQSNDIAEICSYCSRHMKEKSPKKHG